MDYELDPKAGELRERLRALIAEHLPPDFLGAFTDDPHDLATTQQFCKLLAADGLLAKAWPTEFGGGGGSVWEQTVVREEMWAHHEPRGAQHLNEVFFDEVVAGPGDVLGGVGNGWTVIREALRFERVGIARYARCDRLLWQLRDELGDEWDSLPAALRARWARAVVHVRNARLLAYRVVA